MATSIEMQHDPETGTWNFATPDFRQSLIVNGYPDFETWWAWLKREAPADAETFRGRHVRSDFKEAVARIQSACHCLDCRDATVQAAGERAAARRERAVAAGSRLIEESARAVALYVQESAKPAGFVSAPDPFAGRTPKERYEDARIRYMYTGTVADKEAMAACVTESVPDLDTIGPDWEPPAPQPPVAVPKPRISRQRAALSLTVTGFLLVIAGFVTGGLAVLPLTALGFLGLSLALQCWPHLRKTARAVSRGISRPG